jgi:hypothetical protein
MGLAFIKDFNRLKSLPGKYKDSILALEIDNFKDVWTRKSVNWINLSPTISNSALTFYDTVKKSLNDVTSLLWGIQLTYNILTIYQQPGRFLYFRGGFEYKRSNNVGDLSQLQYQSSSVLNTAGTTTISKQKSGTAYKGTLSQYKLGGIFGEFYWTPVKVTAIPGIYLRCEATYATAPVIQYSVSPDIGLLWNVPGKDGKSILSIIPYVNWSNIANSSVDTFTGGIKFAVPINVQ